MIIKKIPCPSTHDTNLIICGVHGDETKAVKLCWDLYRFLKTSKDISVNYTFVFCANEKGMREEKRDFVEPEKDVKDLNRVFRKEESLEDVKEQILQLFKNQSFRITGVLDVHDSATCNSTVLIDYGWASKDLHLVASHFKLNPMVRPLQNIGTLKYFAIGNGIPAYTVEISPMHGELEDNHGEDLDYLKRCVTALNTLRDFKGKGKLRFSDYVDAEWVSKKIYNPVSTAIVKWSVKPYNLYPAGAIVCKLIDIYSEEETIITAPESMIVQDIGCPDVAFAGKALCEYTPCPVADRTEEIQEEMRERYL